MTRIQDQISACTICADRFALTATAHRPRPVVWFEEGARILIASQAPGLRAHNNERPFTDPSGVRLRDWLGLDETAFYDKRNVAIVPMGFCFPGYDAQGADLPPPKVCAATWRAEALAALPNIRLTLLIGGYSQKWHLGQAKGVTEAVKGWKSHWPDILPLPHPSWRNTGWLKKNPWFEAEVLPAVRARVQEVLHDD